jgi:hypothetical protein
MTVTQPPSGPPVTTMDEAIVRMEAIDRALPASDGLACFNRMYLEVTRQVQQRIQAGFFVDAAFMAHLDVVFANIYFDAVDAVSARPNDLPAAWQPLLRQRATPGIEPVQFALAGMNAHINHDLPLAVVTACGDLRTAPTDDSHHQDYQKVDGMLDASEQSIRQSFESGAVLAMDRHAAAVATIIGNWSINAARDVAWDTALALWEVRGVSGARDLLMNALARTVGMASRGLLVVV